MILRLRHAILMILIGIDQLAATVIWSLIYILFGGPMPNPDETISSLVGKSALTGQWWALFAEWMIDNLFVLLGAEPGHCRRSIETDEL